MKKMNLLKVNRMLEEAKLILSEEEAGDANVDQDKPEDEGSHGDDDLNIGGDVAGDEEHADGDEAGDDSVVATDIDKALSGGMESATGIVKKTVGEAVMKALTASYGKSRKGMMKEYNTMSFREMGKLSDRFDEVATKIAENVDLKGIIYDAIGNLLRGSSKK